MAVLMEWIVLMILTMSMKAIAVQNITIKLGFLSNFPPQSHRRQQMCYSNSCERTTVLSMWTFSYDVMGNRQLRDAAKDMEKRDIDITVAYIPYMDLNYLQHVLHGDLHRETQKSSSFAITDWFWYISHMNSSGSSTCDPQEQIARNECSHYSEVARFLADVVRNIGWTYVKLLYESEYEMQTSVITDLLSEAGVRIHQHSIRSDMSDLPFIENHYGMSQDDWSPYLLLANWRSVEAIFEQLNAFDAPGLGPTAMKTFSLWLVWGKDVSSAKLEDKVLNISNVAILERPACGNATISPFPNIQDRICYTWFFGIPGDRSCQESDVKNNVMSNISHALMDIVSTEYTKRPSFKLSTAFWKSDGRQFQPVFEGNKNRFHISQSELFPNTLYGLNDMKLVVTTLKWPLYVARKLNADGEPQYGGLCMDLLTEMANQMNFSYTIKEPEDGEWGRVLNGNWTGLIGDIVYHKADLIYAPVSTQEERVAVMDFTISFYTDYNIVVMRMPDKELSRWKLLLRPLNWSVLVTIASIFPAVTMSLWLCERFSPFYHDFSKRSNFPGLHHLHESMWYMFGALLARCGTFLPKANSGRTILTFWWLFIVLFVATYCGNLMAYLTVTRDTKPFNTIAELLQQSDYIWGTNNGTYLLEALQVSRDPEYRQLWEAMKRFAVTDPWVLHPEFDEQMRRAERGGYAYMTDAAAAEISMANNCDLVKADEMFMMYQYGVGIQKNSAYTMMFSQVIRAITEAGLIEMWKRKWWPKLLPCPAFLHTEAKKIMLPDIQSSFYILIGGIVLSVIVCTFEIFSCKWKPSLFVSKKTK